MGLIPETSEGRISETDVLVSRQTGEMGTVAVYTDPRTNGQTATGAGWSYNPGKVVWTPDLARYDKDIAGL
ncbi:MAG: hypothetical protein M0R70_12720 [Nitrospirae bacterium]|nr:hypothetical protein [Nitrospirota bacterium]